MSGLGLEQIVYKTPGEVVSVPFNFADKLGESDASVTLDASIALDSAGIDKSTQLIRSNTVATKIITSVIQGGSDGEDYLVTVTGVGNVSGDVLALLARVRVRSEVSGA